MPNRLTEQAAHLAKDGKFAEAIAQQKKAIEIAPNNERLHYALAQRYAQAGEYRNALRPLEDAVRRQPYLKKEALGDPVFTKMRDLVEFKRLVGQ